MVPALGPTTPESRDSGEPPAVGGSKDPEQGMMQTGEAVGSVAEAAASAGEATKSCGEAAGSVRGRGSDGVDASAAQENPRTPRAPSGTWGLPRGAFDDLLGSLVSIHSGFDELIGTIPLCLDDLRASTSSPVGHMSLSNANEGVDSPCSWRTPDATLRDPPSTLTPPSVGGHARACSRLRNEEGAAFIEEGATSLSPCVEEGAEESWATPLSKEEALAAAERSLVDRENSVDDILVS